MAKNYLTDRSCIGSSLSHVLPRKSAKEMIKNARFEKMKNEIVETVLIKVQSYLDANVIQGACDVSGISRNAYSTFFRIVKEAFSQVMVKKIYLPRPYRVRLARNFYSDGMFKVVGQPLHITELYKSEYGELNYNDCNNIFLDIENVLKYIIRFYKLDEHQVNGKIIIVIKLDESEIIKGQKLERVSVTLMNKISDTDDRTFSVQSENHIWWLAAFQVYISIFI